ncbi:Leucine-rich repeat-containing protein 15, partial [Pseudolycoriella hygida]
NNFDSFVSVAINIRHFLGALVSFISSHSQQGDEMRSFQLLHLLHIVGIVMIHFPSTFSNQMDVQPNTLQVEGLCFYYYDASDRYTCELRNVVTTAPDDVLIITGNHLPNHTDADVQVVFHVNVLISYFNGEVLRKFPNLEYLAIGNKGIAQIAEDAFEECEKLDRVYISFNDLQTLPPRMLQNCVNLRYLDAYGNGLTSIPENLFGSTTNLERFDVSNNRLNSLPPNLLRNMTKLKEFSIRSNSFENIDRNLLVDAVNLEKIELSSNLISNTSVIMDLLNGHLTLNSIRISRNQFTSFDFTFLSQFTRLIDFEIGGGVSLTGINWSGLPSSLESIYLSDVAEEIPSNAFNNLTNLKHLGFTGYGITTLHEDTFKLLVNLNSLSIQSTRLRELSSNMFVNLVNLTQLYLSYNNIAELPRGVFTSLVNLGLNLSSSDLHLVLNGNRIRSLNANSFGYHPHLRNLWIRGNGIFEIQRGIFSRFPSTMEVVDLSSNSCVDVLFWLQSDLHVDHRLENCFNNWDGITTTTTTMMPSEAFRIEVSLFDILMIFSMIFLLK